ncbi:phage tail tube protein [Enterococcus sp. LJL128]
MLKTNLIKFNAETGATGFAPNWMNKYEVGSVPTADGEPQLFELAAGIQTVEPSTEEETETFAYYGDKGGSNIDVTSVTSAYAFKGHRRYQDDAAQEFIRERLSKSGDGRLIYFRHTEPDGRVREGKATLTGIVHTGGDANMRGNFECTISFNGLPSDKKA